MQSLDASPAYWAEYSNLQKVKHDLIRSYLQGWFPKLGFWAGRIVYFDTHAGRGRHSTGDLGSPLVALDTLLEHASCERILKHSDVRFLFIERNEGNAAALKSELHQRLSLPERVTCETIVGNCFPVLQELINWFREKGRRLAPAFFFIDPYGFKVPGKVLRELMSFERVELFINVIWRELDMALAQPETMAATLDEVFDGDRWRTWTRAENHEERAQTTVEGFKELAGARWATYIRMLGENDATRYLLVHLTNHDAGRDLMKDCMWKVCPQGGFYARKSDNPKQEYLIEPEPDLAPLRAWVLDHLPSRWGALIDALRATVWREPHLTEVIRQLRNEQHIEARDYKGKFGPKANPLLVRKPAVE